MKIWAMFSIENHYDQPENNLVGWWRERPKFETILNAMGGNFDNEESIIAAASVIKGGMGRVSEVDYRLEQISEGVIINE